MQTQSRPEPLDLLDSFLADPYGAIPPPRELAQLDWWLRVEGYTPLAVARTVGYAARHGTLECCEWLEDAADRAIAESLLPDRPAAWAPFDDVATGLGAGAEF